MSRTLVAYFSPTGTTARLASTLAAAAGADLHEIVPATPYTAADLNWNDKKSRSSVEMNDPASRPEIGGSLPDMSGYDTVLLGFPIWWYTAPHIILTFLEKADLAGRTILPFATSGGSSMGGTGDTLRSVRPDATWLEGGVLRATMSRDEAVTWLAGHGIRA